MFGYQFIGDSFQFRTTAGLGQQTRFDLFLVFLGELSEQVLAQLLLSFWDDDWRSASGLALPFSLGLVADFTLNSLGSPC